MIALELTQLLRALLADEALGPDGPHVRPLAEAVLACRAALAAVRRAGVSAGHLHRLILDLHGTAPMAMVRRLRLERAADLLRTTNHSLETVPPGSATVPASPSPTPGIATLACALDGCAAAEGA